MKIFVEDLKEARFRLRPEAGKAVVGLRPLCKRVRQRKEQPESGMRDDFY